MWAFSKNSLGACRLPITHRLPLFKLRPSLHLPARLDHVIDHRRAFLWVEAEPRDRPTELQDDLTGLFVETYVDRDAVFLGDGFDFRLGHSNLLDHTQSLSELQWGGFEPIEKPSTHGIVATERVVANDGRVFLERVLRHLLEPAGFQVKFVTRAVDASLALHLTDVNLAVAIDIELLLTSARHWVYFLESRTHLPRAFFFSLIGFSNSNA
jgi:hypothetical protein